MDLDNVWVLVCAAMVFLMQAGFLCLESGLARAKHVDIVALKNLFDWTLTVPCFSLLGLGLMFGPSIGGFIGNPAIGFGDLGIREATGLESAVFVLFQMAFAGTAATIVFGAIGGRASFPTYITVSIAMAALVYPVVGHWAWGRTVIAGNASWLSVAGFHDFAGSTVVHSTGGWFALVAAWIVGPRIGRFDAEGRPRPLDNASLQRAGLGTLILWFGWWGFNGGSGLAANATAGSAILNTNLAGAGGALLAAWHCWFAQDRAELGIKVMGGGLGGLVAITASCDLATPAAAFAIGAMAGLLHNLSGEVLLNRLKVDDPVGAVPVHLVCGIWGTLVVGLVDPAIGSTGELARSLFVQMAGVLACGAWCAGIAWSSLSIVKRTLGLRLDPGHELGGFVLDGAVAAGTPGADAAGDLEIDEETLAALSGATDG